MSETKWYHDRIEPLGGQFDGYLAQEHPNGQTTIFRADYSHLITGDWAGCVEAMRTDGD